jgi:mRNA-degrading endonuclease YafQ of YafQ-DinJ toxin-antitoxin module
VGTSSEKVFRQRLETFLENPFAPALRTHKLTGCLAGLWAFAVSHDCRVVFDFISPGQVLLIDIGSHEDVY